MHVFIHGLERDEQSTPYDMGSNSVGLSGRGYVYFSAFLVYKIFRIGEPIVIFSETFTKILV